MGLSIYIICIIVGALFILSVGSGYTVVCAIDDYTGFIGRKKFKRFKDAKRFARGNRDLFDVIWIERNWDSKEILVIKE